MVELTENRLRQTTPEMVFDDIGIGILIIDRSGMVAYINSEAVRVVGYENIDRALGSNLQEIEAVFNCGLTDAFGLIINGESFKKQEHRCSNRLGYFATLNIYAGPYRRSDGVIDGVLIIIQDGATGYKKNSELEEAIFGLSIMAQVSEALSSTADRDAVLKIILTGVTANQGLGFNRAFLFLMNEKGDTLTGKMAVGPAGPEEAGRIWAVLAQQQKQLSELLHDYVVHENSGSHMLTSRIEGWSIPLDRESIFSRAIRNNHWLNITVDDKLDRESSEILSRLQTDHLALAPIVSKGRKLGLIVADNQINGKAIIDSDMDMLQMFANNTAVAVERAQLYDDLVRYTTELEQKNQMLADSQAQMIQVEKMSVIGELTSSMAHELRSPLAVIGGFADLMLSTAGNDANTEYLNIILSETRRTESVLHQVLDFSRASRTESREIKFDQIIKQTWELLTSRLKFSQKAPSLMLSRENLTIWGNPDQLQHGLFQFMNLAIDETTGECDVSVTSSKCDNRARLEIGFSGENSARVRVVRTLNQIFNNPGGTQRLAIIAAGETIKYHGGDYGIEGSERNLPKIYIELPIREGEQND